MKRSAEEQLALIRAHTIDLIPEDEVLAKLRSGRPLRVKYGVDPSGPDIHLGHCVPIRKLRLFQDLGHTVVLIIGDFTALIGDPSGRSEMRPQLTRQQVEENMASYREQISKILDPDRTEFTYNSEWLGKLTAEDILRLTTTHTVAQLLAREDFNARYKAEEPISLVEFLYPLFQGYDSVAVRADIEIGATEQKFNLLVGRELQRMGVFGEPQEPQCILTMPILVGTDGVQKMGKSLNNYIGITEPPDQMFGKVMSIPDEVIEQYFDLCTDVPADEVAQMKADMHSGALNPRDAKRRLAREIVTLYHSTEAAEAADETFLRVFSASRETREEDFMKLAKKKSIPPEVRATAADWGTVLALLGLAGSKTEARRFILAGAVWADERRVTEAFGKVLLRPGMLIRVGKRRAVVLEEGGAATEGAPPRTRQS